MAKLDFTITEIVPVDPPLGLFQARVTVELRHDNNQPLNGDVKIIAPSGQEVTISTEPGKGTGRGELLFVSNASIVVLVGEANIQNRLLTAHRTVNLKSKASKLVPDRVSANSAGDNGKYIFIVSVLDKENAPVQDIPIRIIKEDDGTDVDTGQTDQNGAFSSKKITFRENTCSFLIVAGGLDPVRLKLDGPTKWAKVELPPANPGDTQNGLWHAIATGWKRGRDAVKARRTP